MDKQFTTEYILAKTAFHFWFEGTETQSGDVATYKIFYCWSDLNGETNKYLGYLTYNSIKDEPHYTLALSEDEFGNFINGINFNSQADFDKVLFSDFQQWYSHRPEAQLYEPVAAVFAFKAAELELASGKATPYLQKLQNTLETYLGAALLTILSKTRDADEAARKRTQKCIDWLRGTDFYSAPASTQYHESFPGGLALHTLKVVQQVQYLSKLHAFTSVNYAEAILCAIAHDWCKIGKYEMYLKNVKNEETGQWEKQPGYKYKEQEIPLGHGETSLYILQRFAPVSIEMACAVRWHMGAWQVHQTAYNEMQHANEVFPMCHLLQFADQLAITNYATI